MEMRVDGQGFFVAFYRGGNFIEVRVAMAHSGPRAEMAGHSLDGAAAVGNAFIKIFGKVIGDGTLVVGLGKIGIDADSLTEYFDGAGEVARAEGFGAAADELIGFGGFAASEPYGPEGVFGKVIDDRIGIFELMGKLFSAAGGTDEGEGEKGYLSCIAMLGAKEVANLLGMPFCLEQFEKTLQIFFGQKRLDELDEMRWIDCGQGFHPVMLGDANRVFQRDFQRVFNKNPDDEHPRRHPHHRRRIAVRPAGLAGCMGRHKAFLAVRGAYPAAGVHSPFRAWNCIPRRRTEKLR